MDIINNIKLKITNKINCTNIIFHDFSGQHVHYIDPSKSSISHLKVICVSDYFKDMSTLERHKFIFSLIKEEINIIHAIILKTFTNQEYDHFSK